MAVPSPPTALEIIGWSPLIQQATDEALHSWQKLIADKLVHAGLAADSADDAPLRTAARHLHTLVRAVMHGYE